MADGFRFKKPERRSALEGHAAAPRARVRAAEGGQAGCGQGLNREAGELPYLPACVCDPVPENGVNIRIVRQLMGHAGSKTTEIQTQTSG